jgi:hypothetical protein
MRAVWTLLLVASLALGLARTHHLRRAQPEATLSAQAGVHHHARAHRAPAAIPEAPSLPIADTSITALARTPIADPPPAELVVPVARGPPRG